MQPAGSLEPVSAIWGRGRRVVRGEVTAVDSDSSVLARFAYTRDAAGNPVAIERESGGGGILLRI